MLSLKPDITKRRELMAVHIETGTMQAPIKYQEYQSYNLNHLGLIAGMYNELGIGT